MSQIFENIYLGSYADAKNHTFLANLGVTHIVTVGVELQTLYPSDFEYLHIPAYDNSSYKMSVYFDEIADFIYNAADIKYGRVLVHCHWGVSRSVAALMSYLIKYHRMHPAQAKNFIRQRRGNVNPNDGFFQQLEEYANKLCIKFEKSTFGSSLYGSSPRVQFIKESPRFRSTDSSRGFRSTTKSFLPSSTFAKEFYSPTAKSTLDRPQTGFRSAKFSSGKIDGIMIRSTKPKPKFDVEYDDASSRRSNASELQYSLANYTKGLNIPNKTIVAYNSAVLQRDREGANGSIFKAQSRLNEPFSNEKKCEEFFCAECGVRIFSSNDILHNTGKEASETCTSIYLKYSLWLGDIKADIGKIYCPSSKCAGIIGFTNQRGGRCPCGKVIDRMYAIYPVRVTTKKSKRI